MANISKVYCEKIDLENIDLKKVYTFEEFEYINDQLKTRTIQLNGKPVNLFEYENGKLIPMPQTPYARGKVVLEIGRQLANWNIETRQNGGVTFSQGGFNFNVGGQRTILAPDVSFTPKQTDRNLNSLQNWTFQGQPFTPIFIVEVDFIETESQFQVFDDRFRNKIFAQGTAVELGFLVSIGQDENNQLVGNIHSWRRYENSDTVHHYEHGWRDMNTTVNGQQILPGFILDVEMIEKAISKQYSGSSSSDDDTRFACPKCAETFTDNHIFMKHFRKEHALKRRT
ncbi:unnamed protein product [Rhizophagus irregularis]|uniref:C2H2-type domain-containing protein n=1 Tax=Rhizophagus irregularis TaxID=588596 RepID=A0A2N1NH99_9GLOM|nr:hypothetical protein RhiirC2_864574 [Rhizophagus irregularis]CAB4389306.1 unnamed protein product [Rhizophagus irregularis]CAB5343048.1 unnamed protein product [Rhizophagus irregularis]